ncbi:alpha-ketoglutarate-dependent dioxygenase AlkB, partial [Salmonella enterica subsp. enterica serovar Oslo]|uniref:alpha-ketoglutarate-dependent dioxygenase AlkB n=1 Tax=Salmonella enterica TaxID=28901 RepID=UPI00288FB34E
RAPGAVVLRRLAVRAALALVADLGVVASQAPFLQQETPGGSSMSAAMTYCGALGWTSDLHGYGYAVRDPLTDKPWPALPLSFASVCRQAAIAAGYASFQP